MVDSGPASAVDAVSAVIAESPIEILLLTHVHPDHAGAAGGIARRFATVKIAVHERGREHLADPTALNASIRRWTGPLAPCYGDVLSVPIQQIEPLAHGDRIDLGKRVSLEAIDSPGHAPHHLCYFERSAGVLFCGDAMGIRRGNLLVPATVPPSFNLEESLATVRSLAQYQPRVICYSHFGRRRGTGSPFDTYCRSLVRWVEEIATLRHRMSDTEVVRTLVADRRHQSLGRELQLEFEMCVLGVLHFLGNRTGTS
jgi:glyoxylase-like metal-dependent hydrolase (beta-lactamase superfamily II)